MSNDPNLHRVEDREQEIRERAYRIWLEAGQPEGLAADHWALAELEYSHRVGLQSTLQPSQMPRPQTAELQENPTELSTLADQREERTPRAQTRKLPRRERR